MAGRVRTFNGDDLRGGVIMFDASAVAGFVKFDSLPALEDNV
jgi:hypothetical protein